MNRFANRSLRAVLFWRAIRRADQFCFVEALRQCLAAGMEMSAAIMAAQEVNPSGRFRTALAAMARHVRLGHPLEQALTKTGVAVHGPLLGALRVGPERGCLGPMLGVVARGYHPNPAARLADVLGRRPVMRRFADALAELLREHRLTYHLVEDAVVVAAGVQPSRTSRMGEVIDDMRSGSSLGEALLKQRGYLCDPLFCRLIDATDHRELLRSVLMRLSGREVPADLAVV